MKRLILPVAFAALLSRAIAEPVAEPATWRELPAFRLTDGRSEAIVVPSLGGRVVHFGLTGGINWLWTGEPGTEKKMPALAWGGDKTYLGPHSLWSLAQEAMWLEQALSDRMSFRRFVGLSADQAAPDHSTLWRFRQSLAAQGLDRAAFEAVNAQLDGAGLIVRQGALIDASLVAAASHPPRKPKPEEIEAGASLLVKAPREPDADWTRRGGKRIFGYKVHIAMDRGSQLVREVRLTPASVNDTSVADELILGDEAEVWADKAYDSHARRERLKAAKVKNRIMRRGNRHHPETQWCKRRNELIGKVRGRVETAFAILKRHYGHGRARYRSLVRNQADLLLAFIAMNLRRALVLTA